MRITKDNNDLKKVILSTIIIGVVAFGIHLWFTVSNQPTYNHVTWKIGIESTYKLVGSEKGDSYVQTNGGQVYALDDLRNVALGYNLNDVVLTCDSIYKRENSDTLFLIRQSLLSRLDKDSSFYFLIE